MITAACFVVAAGAGALARAEAGRRLDRAVPWGTLVVNVAGAFALGLLVTTAPPAVTVAGTGFLGALTTYSSFARDVVALAEEDGPVPATAYLLATLALGITAAWAGIALTTA